MSEPTNLEFRRVLHKMLDKLQGRRRGYTPPRWWVVAQERCKIYLTMDQVRVDFASIRSNGGLLSVADDDRRREIDQFIADNRGQSDNPNGCLEYPHA